MSLLDDVIGKLSAAALQISPTDDQIIADHIRDSVAMLLKYRSIEAAENKRLRAALQKIYNRGNDGLIDGYQAADIANVALMSTAQVKE